MVAGVDTQAVANGVGSALRNGRHLHQARAVPSTRHKKASEDAFLRMRRQPRRIVSALGPLQLGSRLLRAAGGKIGGARGRGGTEDIPTLHRAAQPGSQIPDSSFGHSDAHLHRPPRWQMGRGVRTSILQSTNPAADIEERYSSGVTQPSVPNTRTVSNRTFGEDVDRTVG